MDRMQDYFPDKYPKGKCCEREYFFTVLFSLYPDYTIKLIKHSKQTRLLKDDDGVPEDAIAMTEEWRGNSKNSPRSQVSI